LGLEELQMNAAGQISQADIDVALRLPTPDEQRLSLVNLLSQALVSEMSETATNASSSLANTNSRAESFRNIASQRASPSSPGSAGGSPRKANSPRKSQERDPKTGAPKGVLRRTATNRSGRILDQPSSIRASGLATQEEAETEFEEDDEESEGDSRPRFGRGDSSRRFGRGIQKPPRPRPKKPARPTPRKPPRPTTKINPSAAPVADPGSCDDTDAFLTAFAPAEIVPDAQIFLLEVAIFTLEYTEKVTESAASRGKTDAGTLPPLERPPVCIRRGADIALHLDLPTQAFETVCVPNYSCMTCFCWCSDANFLCYQRRF
jgi:hypothetical protein